MAKGRKSDTAALTAMPASLGERTVSVRKIDNGYLVRESSYGGPDGENYKCSEHFSPTLPRMQPLEKAEERGESSLREAMEYMKGKG